MGLPLRRLCVAAVYVSVGLVAAESAGTVDVRVVALALPDYGEATARVWRALGVDGLHVGCGPALRPRALNSDLESPVAAAGVDAAFTGIDGVDASRRYFLRHDATTPFPLPSGAFDWVYAEHFIEHVSREGAVRFLREARRLLSTEAGGVIRISSPDLRKYAAGYLDPRREFLHARHRLNGDLMGRPPGAVAPGASPTRALRPARNPRARRRRVLCDPRETCEPYIGHAQQHLPRVRPRERVPLRLPRVPRAPRRR